MFTEANGKVSTIFEPKVVQRTEMVNGVPTKVEKIVRVPIFPAEERSVCLIRNHRSSTTVNGVCLSCQTATGHRPAGQRRNTGTGKTKANEQAKPAAH